MFEWSRKPGTRVLRAPDITAYREQLTAALETGSGLDDAERVDAITALEDLVRVATAAQAALARELDASQRAAQAAAGVPVEVRGRGVAGQVGLARKESHHRGQRHLALAKVVPAEMPHLWAAWRQGKVTEHGATHAARETACLEVEDRLEIDRLLAADPDTLDTMSARDIASFCRNHAARLDPTAAVKRRRRAEEDRCVTIRPAPDTMVYLTALLPVKDGVACYAALSKTAGTARAEGEARTKGQVMADTLVDHVLAGHHATTGARVDLGLVMTDRSVFGHAEDPALIDGYGSIPAELGRELLTDSLAAGEELWLRRLYASPTTGELVAMDSRARTYPAGLAKFIRLRDQVCRTPWCDAPIRHTDHAEAVADGGQTTAENGQGLCEACNLAKQAPGWHARPSPDDPGTIETTTPTGHQHRTRPPALVTIHEVDAPPLHIDYYVLAT
ncbi:HNH endonuclease [Nocardioides deserti]|uniref:HNH endonuclease n=1 Tax=Nocardioides deserti TaxID=1588644 RepID=A0ABR6U6Q7_9ACTN|nr:HNH endonuclease [Nocardioides deserti]MBC2960122.1 HNH endonuclease [Nocardioides deserti]GGO74861.1 HNH endonuclease [Nocardioides deserti]